MQRKCFTTHAFTVNVARAASYRIARTVYNILWLNLVRRKNMTLKLTRLADGSMSVEGDEAAAYVDALLAEEERSIEFPSELSPPTDRERRTRLAALRSVVDVPREEAWRVFLRGGRE